MTTNPDATSRGNHDQGPPMIYRPALEKADAMRADPARYFAICTTQRRAETKGLPIPPDDEIYVCPAWIRDEELRHCSYSEEDLAAIHAANELTWRRGVSREREKGSRGDGGTSAPTGYV